jgi:thiamine-phosphate pyrophosphorylase
MARFDLCVITAHAERPRRGHVDVARAALEGGATMIQLREKDLSTRALLELAEQIGALTREHSAAFVVNDRVDVALAAEADGVHLGMEDMPIATARRLLGAERLIGASVDDPADARRAEAAGADYLGVGPVFATGSKADAGDPIGLGPIGEIKRAVSIPVLAIGGLTCDNVENVIRAGADGIAVISAVTEAADMVAATRALRDCVQKTRRNSGEQERYE